MRKLAALLLTLVAVSVVPSSVTANHSAVLNSADSRDIAVEAVQVAELPVSVREVVLEKTRNG